MQKAARSDAWAQLLLAEAKARLEAARAGAVVADVDDHPAGRPLHGDGRDPVIRLGRLVRRFRKQCPTPAGSR